MRGPINRLFTADISTDTKPISLYAKYLDKVDSVSSKLSDCHRVIILLTPEYISDQWDVYEAYEV